MVGLRRVRGGTTTGVRTAGIGENGESPALVMSQQVRFLSPDGSSISVGSHRGDSQDRYDTTRLWAPMNAYLATPAGRADIESRGSFVVPRPPEDLVWAPAVISVDGLPTPFEVCDLSQGVWVGVGRIPDLTLSIDSRGVPLGTVRLGRIIDHRVPPPPPPEVDELGALVLEALDSRFGQLPVNRVRRPADLYALMSVETDHVDKLVHEFALPADQAEAVRGYWQERIGSHFEGKFVDIRRSHAMAFRRSRVARRLGRGLLFQLWFNTIGPGARTWFGNRYAGIRHYTFRIRWRP